MKRIEKCLEPIKDQMIRLSKVGDNSFEKAISILIKIMDWPYEKAWLRDYINILNEITEYKRDLIVLTDDIEESKTLIKELFKAVKNEDFNFFYLPTDNICRIKDEFFIRGKKLRTLFLKALEKLENSNKNLWKTQFELYNKSEAAKIELENKEKELKIKSDLKEKSKIALKNFKSNREIIAKFRDELDKIIKHQNEKNEWDYDYKGVEIIIRKGDLVEEHSDAIVNPANEYLMHDGGAARAIAEKAGDQFATDCHEYISKNGKLSVGNAMISAAGGTLCGNMVIHAVGPVYNKKSPDNSLAEAQLRLGADNILKLIHENGINSISIPAISTGIFGFPIQKCARILGNSIKNEIDSSRQSLRGKQIIFCNYDSSTTEYFTTNIPPIFDEELRQKKNEEQAEKKEKKSKRQEPEDSDENNEEDNQDDEDESEEIVKSKKNKKNKRRS